MAGLCARFLNQNRGSVLRSFDQSFAWRSSDICGATLTYLGDVRVFFCGVTIMS